jgi:hypothetical protein
VIWNRVSNLCTIFKDGSNEKKNEISGCLSMCFNLSRRSEM